MGKVPVDKCQLVKRLSLAECLPNSAAIEATPPSTNGLNISAVFDGRLVSALFPKVFTLGRDDVTTVAALLC